jgi:hypothetical protein
MRVSRNGAEDVRERPSQRLPESGKTGSDNATVCLNQSPYSAIDKVPCGVGFVGKRVLDRCCPEDGRDSNAYMESAIDS